MSAYFPRMVLNLYGAKVPIHPLRSSFSPLVQVTKIGYSGSSIIVQQHQYNSNGSSIVYQGPIENAKNGRAGNKNFQSVSPDPLAVYKN